MDKGQQELSEAIRSEHGSDAVTTFRDEHAWLSNFARLQHLVVVDGIKYNTVEHAFQAATTPDHKRNWL